MSLIINDVIFLRRPVLNYVTPAICEVFSSSTGSSILSITAAELPPAPVNVRAEGCVLFWDPPANPLCPNIPAGCAVPPSPAICYTVYRSDTIEGPYSTIAECINALFLELGTFGNGYYRVSDITLNGESELSSPVLVECVTLPPTNVTTSDCFLSWDASETSSVTCYNIYRADIGPGPYLLVAGCIESLSLYLGPYGDGFYRVSAVSPIGESELTDPISAVCIPPCSDSEVDDWVQRILSNGGTVSNTTIEAACEFMTSLKAAGLRDRVFRLNLFAGDQFAAAVVPLINDFGSAVDAPFRLVGNTILAGNSSNFSYQETGVVGGIQPILSQSYFNTGVFAEFSPEFTDSDCGLTFYNKTPSIIDSTEIGALSFNTPNQIRITVSGSDSKSYGFAGGNGNFDFAAANDPNGVGLYEVSRTANTITLHKNGVFMANHLGAGPGLPSNSEILIFAFGNGTGISIQFSSRQSAGYAIHGGFDAQQSADWYVIWQTFQTALGRQV